MTSGRRFRAGDRTEAEQADKDHATAVIRSWTGRRQVLVPHETGSGERKARAPCLCAKSSRINEVASEYMCIVPHRISSVAPLLNFLPDGRAGTITLKKPFGPRCVPFSRIETLSRAPEPSLLAAPFSWRCSISLVRCSVPIYRDNLKVPRCCRADTLEPGRMPGGRHIGKFRLPSQIWACTPSPGTAPILIFSRGSS